MLEVVRVCLRTKIQIRSFPGYFTKIGEIMAVFLRRLLLLQYLLLFTKLFTDTCFLHVETLDKGKGLIYHLIRCVRHV